MSKLSHAISFVLVVAVTRVALSATAGSLVEPSSFKYGDLQKILTTAQPDSVVSLLSLLPDSFKMHVAFVKDSGSLQESSEQKPRVLMYGDGDLVITFNSDPSQTGYEAIELTHYDWTRHQFVFEEHVFQRDLDARKSSILKNEAQETTTRVREQIEELSHRQERQGPNPALCLQCHESSHHPLLPDYPKGEAFLGGYAGIHDDKSNWFTSLITSYTANDRLHQITADPSVRASLLAGEGSKEFNRLMNVRNRDRLAANVLSRANTSALIIKRLISALGDCDGPSATRVARVRQIIEGEIKLTMAEQFTTDGAYASYNFEGVDGGIEQLLPPLLAQIPSNSPGVALPNLKPLASFCERLSQQ